VPARRLLALGAAAAVAAFAAFGELVASGAANGLDQWANNHAMPLAGKPQAPPTLLESLVPLLHASFHPVGVAIVDVVTLPGQVVLSLLLVLTAAFTFWRCGRLEAATAWTAAWVVAVAVEFLCRHAVTRPALYRDGVHVISFDSSWPSGHVLRCALVAAALGAAWRRFRPALAIWLAAAVVLTELAGFHTPSDVIGGLLLATAAVAGTAVLERSGLLLRWAALRGPRARTRA
jgi:membrane-associated phospholipid phosphatase